jgi:hypothetical protein
VNPKPKNGFGLRGDAWKTRGAIRVIRLLIRVIRNPGVAIQNRGTGASIHADPLLKPGGIS